MPFPSKLAEAIDALDRPLTEDGELARGSLVCEGSKFHSPNPLVVHPVHLPDGSAVMLCGTCRDNHIVLRSLMDASDEPVAWPVRREFGNLIRAIAERGTDG